MEKKNAKAREISFVSVKNGTVVTVHNVLARLFADILEKDDKVKNYQTNCLLKDVCAVADVLGIRPSYLDEEWTSDFFIEKTNGTSVVVEVADAESLEKKAIVEKLELSRRYWKACGVAEWKIAVMEKGEVSW